MYNVKEIDVESDGKMQEAVQIRVPVVAIVVPRMKHGERLHLAVEEPHHAFHTALSADGKNVIKITFTVELKCYNKICIAFICKITF